MSLTYNENILSETAVQEHGPTTIFIIERYRVKPMVSAIVCEVHNPEIKPFFNFDLSQDNRKSLRKNSKPLQVAASECKWL